MHWFSLSRENSPLCRDNKSRSSSAGTSQPWWEPLVRRSSCIMDNRSFEINRREPSIRRELVERVRREIAAGTYDTPEKMEKALDRFLDRLEEE